MQEHIIQEGVDLLLYGMGTVIVFLTLLVIATTAMSGVVQRYFPDRIPPPPAPPTPSQVDDPRLLAIIRSAIEQHRARNK